MLAQDFFCPPQRAADNLADVMQSGIGDDRTGFQLGHVEQVRDEAIEPLRLVDDGRQQIRLLGFGKIIRHASERARRPEHRRQRGLEIV